LEKTPARNSALFENRLESRIAQRLMALRTERGLPLEALAIRSGISRATLSRIERCELSPTAAMLTQLCAVYGWTISRLIADAETDSPHMIRAKDQLSWTDPASGYVRRSVSPPSAGLRAELVEVRLPPGAAVSFDKSPIPGLEHHLWMQAGTLDLDVEGTGFRLHAGDCLRYVLTGATQFQCVGKKDARYIIAIVHP
jgi:transcriptional regulator with XRE-family HTH domain